MKFCAASKGRESRNRTLVAHILHFPRPRLLDLRKSRGQGGRTAIGHNLVKM